MAMSPGTYLRLRREAAGVTLEAAAIALAHGLKNRNTLLALEDIEADLRGASPTEIARLGLAFRFDGATFDQLTDIHFFRADLPHPRICRVCACSELDPCIDFDRQLACHWVDLDLCSACVTQHGRAAA